jgi:uncharacterized protein
MTMAALAAAAGGAGGVWAAAHRFADRQWTALGAAATGLFTAAAVLVVALPILWHSGLDAFGAIHVAYLGLTVTVPLVGVGLAGAAVTRQGGMRRWSAALCLPLLVPGLVGWYATHVEPTRLQVEHETVPVLSAAPGDDTIRIGVLADLQTDRVGSHERRAVRMLLDEEPDLILIPGDLFQGRPSQFDREEDALRELLSQLDAPHGVFFVYGDTDGRATRQAERALAGAEAVILENEVAEVTVRGQVLRIGGSGLDHGSAAAHRMYRDLEAPADTASAGPDTPEADSVVRILMSHRPDAALMLDPESPIDLVVAGHTHGGQIVVPLFGPPLTLSDVPREAARGGLHEVNGNLLYVSRGVGLERGQAPQMRLFSRPTIGILELA